jgi:hypothetical protein
MLSPVSFFRSITRSIWDREIYKDFLVRPWGFSLGWFYAVLTALSLLWIAPLIFSFASFTPRAHEFLQTTLEDVRMWYPDTLEIRIQNGTLSTNVTEPYVLDFPPRWKPVQREEFPFDHLLTIDTDAHVEDLAASRSFALVTGSAIAVRDENSAQMRVFMLTNINDILINKQRMDGAIDAALPYLQYVRPLMVWSLFGMLIIFPLLAAGVRMLWLLCVVLLTSALLYVVTKAMHHPFAYATIYRLSLHGITGSLCWKLLESWFQFHAPLVALGLFLVWMIYVLRSLPNETKS